jgi:MoaA/NifB/PqqE/SkfB family radical SAM enzyme
VNVALVNPPLRIARDFIDYPFFANVGLLQAAAVCRAKGFHIVVVDAFAMAESRMRIDAAGSFLLGAGVTDVAATLERTAPEAVVVAHGPFVHPNSCGADLLDELLTALRHRLGATPIVLADCAVGGMHYREYDTEVVLARTGADYLVRYEAEEALPALLNSIERPCSAQVVQAAEEVDLDSLPFPAFDLIDLDAYDRFLESCFNGNLRVPLFELRGRALPLLLSRGCPFRCVFCTSNPGRAVDKPKHQRRMATARARELIRHLAVDLGARTIVLLDDLPNLDDDAFTAVLAQVAGLGVRIEMPNGLRADRLRREHLAQLRGHTSLVSISAESGSQRVLDEVIGKRQDLRAIERVAADCYELGIPLLVHFMLGLPGERRAETLATLQLAWRLHAEYCARPALQFATPLEGSALWEQASEADLLPRDGSDLASLMQTGPAVAWSEALPAEIATAKRLLEDRISADQQAKLILNLTYQCNNHCVFCAVGDRSAGAGSAETHVRILREHAMRGIRLLDLDGGEPTLVPHLLPLIRIARRLGFERVCVTTNGRRLSYESFARKLLESGITDLLISLHGPTADVHEKLTRCPGSFSQTVAGIENAVRLNAEGQVALGVNTTLTRDNFRALPTLAALVRQLGVSKLNVQFVTPFGRARSEIVPDPVEAAPVLRQVIDEHGEQLHIQVVNLPFCYLPGYERWLASDLFKHARNMVFVSAEEVNLASYLRSTRERREQCRECLLSVACDGVFRFDAEGARPSRTAPETNGNVRLVDVILGYRCNSSCSFCAIDEELRATNSTAAEVADRIRSALVHRPRAIRFGGGEPTLWQELPDLVAMARDLGLREISVQTNGYLLGENDLARRLIDAGLSKLNLSLRGADAATHEGLTRTPGSFARLLRGLAAVRTREPGLAIEGDVIVTRQTLPQLAEIVRTFAPLGIRKYNFWHVAIEGRTCGQEELLVPRLSETTPHLLAALDAADALGMHGAEVYYVPYCFLPGREDRVWHPADEAALVITPQSTFRLEMGAIDWGVKTQRCRGCRFEQRCFGVRPSYLQVFGDGEIKPVPTVPAG